MERKKVCFEVESGEIRLYRISDQEKKELESFLKEIPLEFYFLRELLALRERLDRQLPTQWVQKYEYRLDTAKTNFLIDQFPSQARFLYVHSCSGVVVLNFHSQNEPAWTLTVKDQFQMPFQAIYLSWTAQATKKLILYVSNREILRTTLA